MSSIDSHNSYNNLPEVVKEYLIMNDVPFKVKSLIIEAFNKASEVNYNKEKRYKKADERKIREDCSIKKSKELIERTTLIREINKTMKHRILYYLEQKLIKEIKEWKIGCIPHYPNHPKIPVHDLTLCYDLIFEIWENSMKVSFETTDPRPEDWYDIKKCIFKFSPGNISIQDQVDLLKKFKDSLDEY